MDLNEVKNAIQNAETLFGEIDRTASVDLFNRYTFDETTYTLAKQIVKTTKQLIDQHNQQTNAQTETTICKLNLYTVWLGLRHTEKYIGTNPPIYQGPNDILTRTKRALTSYEFDQQWEIIRTTQDTNIRFEKLNALKKKISTLRKPEQINNDCKKVIPNIQCQKHTNTSNKRENY